MLQRQAFADVAPNLEEGSAFSLGSLLEIAKRRLLYFVIPFLTVLALGTLVTFGWPAKYLAEGKILISSQEIPKELVRPTVSTLANERIQYIQQRIMTRDNVLALAKKFNLSMGWRGLVSGTEMVDFVRERTVIKPLEGTLQQQGDKKQAIAFSVGFEYEQPQIATRVANELVTMILNEDVRTRTNFASETTKFLEREVKRLEDQLATLNNDIADRQRLFATGAFDPTDDSKNIGALRAQLAIKGATLSDSHPDVRALKRQLEALEKNAVAAQKAASSSSDPDAVQKDIVAGNTNPASLDAALQQRASMRKELDEATQRLAAARLGENLERGQHSERLEVIEQPTLPKTPMSPNRPKIFAFALAFALAAGGGFLVGAELLNPAIRRSSDIFSLVDSHLIVSIPVIHTKDEVRNKKSRRMYWLSGVLTVVLAALIVVFFILPPLDIVFDKIMAMLLR